MFSKLEYERVLYLIRQFGGFQLFWEYAKLGALRPGIKTFFQCLVRRQSFKQIYPEVLKKVEPFLARKYYNLLLERKAFYQLQTQEHKRSNIIWFCWLQGFDNAPELVRVCYNSLGKHLTDRDITLIDGNNWREFVELPDYIVRKWQKGRIPPANFSDLLRLELLIKYGGTWIDSTVLCTGTHHTKEYLDADLFLFQYTPKGTRTGVSISNWFITSCTNNEVLMVLRDMLHAYWRDFNCTLNYYIFHQFFYLLSQEYPERIASMPYGGSQRSIALLHHLNDTFNQDRWEWLVSQVCFHKLSYRVDKKVKENKLNYYNRILNS